MELSKLQVGSQIRVGKIYYFCGGPLLFETAKGDTNALLVLQTDDFELLIVCAPNADLVKMSNHELTMFDVFNQPKYCKAIVGDSWIIEEIEFHDEPPPEEILTIKGVFLSLNKT